MFQIDTDTTVNAMPAPGAVGTPGWFTGGNPGPGSPVPATNFSPDWCNGIQGELLSILSAAGIAPDKTKIDQVLTAIQKLGRIKLTGNTTFYVDNAAGSDANNGLAAGAGHAWQTIQHAINVIQTAYDCGGFVVTIQLADGTYAGAEAEAQPLVGATSPTPLIINGNAITPSNVVIGNSITARFGASLQVQNFKVASSADGLVANDGGLLTMGVGIEFGTCTGAHIYAATGGKITLSGNYKISGGASAHYQAINGGILNIGAPTVTLSGTPAFSTAFANILLLSLLGFSAAPTFAGTGASGTRYIANFNSVINTSSANVSLFPGSIAGATSTGAQYN